MEEIAMKRKKLTNVSFGPVTTHSSLVGFHCYDGNTQICT